MKTGKIKDINKKGETGTYVYVSFKEIEKKFNFPFKIKSGFCWVDQKEISFYDK